MTIITKEHFDFGFDSGACDACGGRCCRGVKGSVWVDRREIEQICKLLEINIVDGMQACVWKKDNRHCLKERVVGDDWQCLFLDSESGKCAIYPARPRQCRQFPFWPVFKNDPASAQAQCPGVRLDGHIKH